MRYRLHMVTGAAALTLLLSGCASTGFLGFIATTQYVDKHLATAQQQTQAQIAENTNEVHKVRSDVAKLNELRSTLQSLVADINRNKKSTEELKSLAAKMETRLNEIPRETLMQLVQILQQYLKQNQAAPQSGAHTNGGSSSAPPG